MVGHVFRGPEHGHVERAARLRHGNATEQVEGCNDASCFFNSRSRKCTSLGRLLGTSRQRWSAVEKKGRRGRGGHAHELFITNGRNLAWGHHISPLLLGRRCISHLQLCQLMGTPASTAVKQSSTASRTVPDSQCRGAFSHRRTLIDRVCATLHRGRPVSVAESSRRWPCRGQKENLLCVPAPKPSLHLTSHQKFRLEEVVQISILEDGGRQSQ